MKSGRYTPERGDIVWIDFTPQAGHEQRGKRPAVVLSPKIYNEKTSLSICLPITSKVKGYPFEVPLPEGLPVQGVILADQIKSMDFIARNITFAGRIPTEILEDIQKKVWVLLG